MQNANEKKLNPNDGYITFDTKNFLTGNRSLKFLFKGTTGAWNLTQPLHLTPGKRYRAIARVKGEEPRNLRLEVILPNGFSSPCRGKDDQNWQTLSVDFVTPPNSGVCRLLVWGSKTSEGKAAWLDSVSVRELVDVSQPAAPPAPPRKTVGEDLLSKGGKSAKWVIASPTKAGMVKKEADNVTALTVKAKGSFIYNTRTQLVPGKEYRFAFEIKNDRARLCSPSVRCGKQDFGCTLSPLADWQKGHIDFTVSEGKGDTALRFWAGNVMPGEHVRLRNISLKELAK